MNTPNKLTILRILLIPLFLLFLFWSTLPYHILLALIVFLMAAITDGIDGYLARKNNQITNFGKFLDPLADKMLVTSAFLSFIELGKAPAIAVILILGREFLVTSIRLVSSSDGTVISANTFGKIKTVSQMVSIVIILILIALDPRISSIMNVTNICHIILWINAIITILSGLTYLWDYRHSIDIKK